MEFSRRDVLKVSAAALGGAALSPLAQACGSDSSPPLSQQPTGELVHVLPTVSEHRILLKASFASPQSENPTLHIDGRRFDGLRTDSAGYFWLFDADGLPAGQHFTLEVRRGRELLAEAWQLATFPDRDTSPDHFRLLVCGCAGGNDIFNLYQTVETRRRLFERALAEEPDAAVLSGDHVYWDLRSFPNALLTGASEIGIDHAGRFDFAQPVIGTPNESVLKLAVGPQIADLYGTLFRSVPVFFLRDDHDYFEDDRFTDAFVAPPPDEFSIRLARASQFLYYPELLPDPSRALSLPGANASDRPAGVSEAFGTLRYGRLFEGLLYDCKGFLSLAGGGLVPAAVEAWLLGRTLDSTADHVVHFPSNPPGWSAGKYAEWYPDVVDAEGRLTDEITKPGWKRGWFEQHNRLVGAMSERSGTPLFVASDIHSIAEERILASAEASFANNPVVSVIAGSPGTRLGWPSAARGAVAAAPVALQTEDVVPVQEINGFQIIDFEPGRISIRHYGWDFRSQSEEEIDSLQPQHTSVYGARPL